VAVRDPIEINAKIMLGMPVIRGTRIPVELLATSAPRREKL
jgi:uncharacterized protein (DUF433 family)